MINNIYTILLLLYQFSELGFVILTNYSHNESDDQWNILKVHNFNVEGRKKLTELNKLIHNYTSSFLRVFIIKIKMNTFIV